MLESIKSGKLQERPIPVIWDIRAPTELKVKGLIN